MPAAIKVMGAAGANRLQAPLSNELLGKFCRVTINCGLQISYSLLTSYANRTSSVPCDAIAHQHLASHHHRLHFAAGCGIDELAHWRLQNRRQVERLQIHQDEVSLPALP